MNLIKTNFKKYSSMIGLKNIIIIIISLIANNYFQIINTRKDVISFTYNLVLSYSNLFYYFIIYIICFFIIFKILNYYNKDCLFLVRYKNIEEYRKTIFKNILITTGIVFIINFIISIIISSFDHLFVYSDSNFIYYDIPCSLYVLYYYIRLYIILVVLSFITTKIYTRFRNIVLSGIPAIIFILLMYIISYLPSDNIYNILKLSSAYYLYFHNYGSIFNETISFFFYEVLKVGIIYYLINILNEININALILDVRYILNNKKNYIFIFLYITANIINYFNTRDINYLLFNFSKDYYFIISIILKLMSFTSFIAILYSYIMYDKEFCISFIRSRISNKQHLYIKYIICAIIFIIFRLPIYLYANNIYAIIDLIIYIISILVISLLRHAKYV